MTPYFKLFLIFLPKMFIFSAVLCSLFPIILDKNTAQEKTLLDLGPSHLTKMAKGDPRKPKGKMSSYAYFVQTCREEHKKKSPEIPVSFSEFSKRCSARWKVRFEMSFSNII